MNRPREGKGKHVKMRKLKNPRNLGYNWFSVIIDALIIVGNEPRCKLKELIHGRGGMHMISDKKKRRWVWMADLCEGE